MSPEDTSARLLFDKTCRRPSFYRLYALKGTEMEPAFSSVIAFYPCSPTTEAREKSLLRKTGQYIGNCFVLEPHGYLCGPTRDISFRRLVEERLCQILFQSSKHHHLSVSDYTSNVKTGNVFKLAHALLMDTLHTISRFKSR